MNLITGKKLRTPVRKTQRKKWATHSISVKAQAVAKIHAKLAKVAFGVTELILQNKVKQQQNKGKDGNKLLLALTNVVKLSKECVDNVERMSWLINIDKKVDTIYRIPQKLQTVCEFVNNNHSKMVTNFTQQELHMLLDKLKFLIPL